MRIRVQEVAKLFNVSEKTVYRWISQQRIPFYKISGQYRFNKEELLEWSMNQSVKLSPEIVEEQQETSGYDLCEALKLGGIFYRVEGRDKETVLRNITNLTPIQGYVDRDYFLQMLLMRESMGSTGIGNGIAIPHTRSPIVLDMKKPVISLAFLEDPIDFNSVDGKAVYTLFTLVSPTIKAHLTLLSKLAYGLQGGEFLEAVKNQKRREDILSAAALIDGQLARNQVPV